MLVCPINFKMRVDNRAKTVWKIQNSATLIFSFCTLFYFFLFFTSISLSWRKRRRQTVSKLYYELVTAVSNRVGKGTRMQKIFLFQRVSTYAIVAWKRQTQVTTYYDWLWKLGQWKWKHSLFTIDISNSMINNH